MEECREVTSSEGFAETAPVWIIYITIRETQKGRIE